MPRRTQLHQPDFSPPPSSSTRRPHLTLEGGILGQAELTAGYSTRSGTAGALHQNSNTLGAGCKVAQEPGHLPGIVQPVLGGKLTPANKVVINCNEAARLLSGSGCGDGPHW